MSKDPAILFYPNDWLGGTMGMTFQEKGAYFELLMLQFNRGHMTSHMIGQQVGQLWVNVQVKFKQDEKGLWYNERLEMEIEKRKKFVQSRNNNLSGKNQYSNENKIKNGHMGGHVTPHMENENENINVNNEKGVQGKKQKEDFNPELFQEIKEKLTGQVWAEGTCMRCEFDIEKFKALTSDFLNDIRSTGEYSEPIIKIRTHLINIYKKKYPKDQKIQELVSEQKKKKQAERINKIKSHE
jgi:uncharacterized protein YdaU (DUF1376 family)